MVRIAQGVYPEDVQERNYFTPQGEYRVDSAAPSTMLNSLMYRLSYYRFSELQTGAPGHDRVRGTQIGLQKYALNVVDEAFTSENWIVRIYRVKKPDPLGRSLFEARAFEDGRTTAEKRAADRLRRGRSSVGRKKERLQKMREEKVKA